MFSLREHDHRDAALQIPPRQTGGGGIPLAMPRSSSSGSRRATSAHGQGDLKVTVRASPSSASPWASHSSSALHHLLFLDELVVSSDRAVPSILSGAPADDRMSIAASEGELGSGDDDSAALPLSGRVALPESDPGLTAMLSRAAEDCTGGLLLLPNAQGWTSWRAPFSARNRASASSVLTALDGGVAKGYVEIPPVERAIAVQLCPRAPPPGRVIHASHPGLVGSRPFQMQRLTQLLDRPPLPCTPWPSCKPTRPRR